MNPQWNTPPNGDFASYVERLSAQAAQPRREHQDGEHGLDVGMTPSSAPHGAVGDAAVAARRRMQSNGESRAGENNAGRGGSVVPHNLAKVMVIVWFAMLVLLMSFGVPFSIVVAIFVFGVWLAHRLRNWALPPDAANWRQWLEQEARKQQQRKQQGRSK